MRTNKAPLISEVPTLTLSLRNPAFWPTPRTGIHQTFENKLINWLCIILSLEYFFGDEINYLTNYLWLSVEIVFLGENMDVTTLLLKKRGMRPTACGLEALVTKEKCLYYSTVNVLVLGADGSSLVSPSPFSPLPERDFTIWVQFWTTCRLLV